MLKLMGVSGSLGSGWGVLSVWMPPSRVWVKPSGRRLMAPSFTVKVKASLVPDGVPSRKLYRSRPVLMSSWVKLAPGSSPTQVPPMFRCNSPLAGSAAVVRV